MALNAVQCATEIIDAMEAAGTLARDMLGPNGEELFPSDEAYEDAKVAAASSMLPLVSAIFEHIKANAEVSTAVAVAAITGVAATDATPVLDGASATIGHVAGDAAVTGTGTGTGTGTVS